MQSIQAIITGSIQGLSEFLPVSSSAHIVFSNLLYDLITNSQASVQSHFEEIFFDIVVHLATLFAVLIYFFNDLKSIVIGFVKSIKTKDYNSEAFKMVLYITVSFIITGIVGFLIKGKVENLIKYPKYICILLFVTGLILFFSEKMYKGDKKINLKCVILIAIAQGLAVFPGFSRSGLTISMALFNGIDRVSAARFSFLMSIPVIFFASLIYPVIELDFSEVMSFNLKAIAIGFVVSFVVGYFCIKYFMKLLSKISLKGFSYYCFVVATVMFLLFQFYYHI